MVKKNSLVLSAAILIVTVSLSANATPPEKDVTTYPFQEYIVDCGGWSVVTEGVMKETLTWFFDKKGGPEPSTLHVSLSVRESRWFNSEHQDIFIQQGSKGVGENASIWINLVTGRERNSGGWYRITAPGYGPLVINVGHYTWDGENFTRNGLFLMPEDGTGSLLCDILSAD